MSKLRRPRATLGLDSDNYPELHTRADAIYTGLSENPEVFTNPNPPLPILQGKIQAFYLAQQSATTTRAKGSADQRNIKAGELVTCLETTRAYVQEICDANPAEKAMIIIKMAGMIVGRAPVFKKPLLQAKQHQPGSAVQIIAHVGMLTAETSGRVFFNWQISSDGGATWTNAPSTPHGRTELTGLTPMTTYAFRVSVTDAGGTGPWSPALTFNVQ